MKIVDISSSYAQRKYERLHAMMNQWEFYTQEISEPTYKQFTYLVGWRDCCAWSIGVPTKHTISAKLTTKGNSGFAEGLHLCQGLFIGLSARISLPSAALGTKILTELPPLPRVGPSAG
jgi:hypothetical protein